MAKEKKIKNTVKSEGSSSSGQVLETLSKQELINLAGQDNSGKNYSKLNKAELIKIIGNNKQQEETIAGPQATETETESTDKKTEPIHFSDFIPAFLKKIFNKITGIKAEEADSATESSLTEKLEALSRQGLVEIAKELKIKNYSRLNKVELIKEINRLISPDQLESLESYHEPQIPIEDVSGQENFVAPSREEEIVLDTDQDETDFEALSRQELVEIAKELKIKNYSRLNKTRLIKLISEAKTDNQKKKVTARPATAKQATVVLVEPPEAAETETGEIETGIEKTEEHDHADLIERISQHLISPYVDEREARSESLKLKTKILLTPSKFPKGKTNKEFLLEEDDIELPELYEENKIVLLPVDPFRVYAYWNLSSETLKMIESLNLQQLVLKVNDVTNIVYNGKNANHYWFESCISLAKNWYIYLLDGNKNIKVELGYVMDGQFNILATSNTIFVPRRNPSSHVEDKFVIVNYPEIQTKTKKLVFRLPSGKGIPYYGYDDQSISENYNTRRLSHKLPVFSLSENIPEHFVKEYEMTGPSPANHGQTARLAPPARLPAPPPVQVRKHPTEKVQHFIPEQTKPGVVTPGTVVKHSDLIRITRDEIPRTIREQFEYFSTEEGRKIIVDQYYYEVPGQEQKIIKVTYQWYEGEIPFRREVYWTSESIPQIHEKIYKISWGPTWVKEFIGNSEHIRFLGASERFIGGSEQFMGGSEMFLGASGRFMGASEFFQGGSERFMGASEIYLGGSERFIGASERHIGGSEQFIGGSERLISRSDHPIGGSEMLLGAV